MTEQTTDQPTALAFHTFQPNVTAWRDADDPSGWRMEADWSDSYLGAYDPLVVHTEHDTQHPDADAATAHVDGLRDARRALLAEFEEWEANRADLSAAEGEGGGYVDWSDSDDTGCDLARRAVELLRALS